MSDPSPLDRLRAQTESYQKDAGCLARWGGLSLEDVWLRTAQERAFVELLEPIWRDLAGLSILDVGCGSARWMRWYLELGADATRVEGVDVSDARFGEARTLNPTLSMRLIDGEHLPFEDASFDLVTQWVCFMCIPDQAWRHRMAKEILRVLRPGGYLYWWDMPRANTDLTDGLPIDPALFFPGLNVERRLIRARALPSEALRAGWVRRRLGPALDRLAPPFTHVAARVGPK